LYQFVSFRANAFAIANALFGASTYYCCISFLPFPSLTTFIYFRNAPPFSYVAVDLIFDDNNENSTATGAGSSNHNLNGTSSTTNSSSYSSSGDNNNNGNGGFAADAGFWPALRQLAWRTTVPIVLTANTCPAALRNKNMNFIHCKHETLERPTPRECASYMLDRLDPTNGSPSPSPTSPRPAVVELLSQPQPPSYSPFEQVCRLLNCDLRRISRELQSHCFHSKHSDIAIGAEAEAELMTQSSSISSTTKATSKAKKKNTKKSRGAVLMDKNKLVAEIPVIAAAAASAAGSDSLSFRVTMGTGATGKMNVLCDHVQFTKTVMHMPVTSSLLPDAAAKQQHEQAQAAGTPVIYSISPKCVPSETGGTLTVTGRHFTTAHSNSNCHCHSSSALRLFVGGTQLRLQPRHDTDNENEHEHSCFDILSDEIIRVKVPPCCSNNKQKDWLGRSLFLVDENDPVSCRYVSVEVRLASTPQQGSFSMVNVDVDVDDNTTHSKKEANSSDSSTNASYPYPSPPCSTNTVPLLVGGATTFAYTFPEPVDVNSIDMTPPRGRVEFLQAIKKKKEQHQQQQQQQTEQILLSNTQDETNNNGSTSTTTAAAENKTAVVASSTIKETTVVTTGNTVVDNSPSGHVVAEQPQHVNVNHKKQPSTATATCLTIIHKKKKHLNKKRNIIQDNKLCDDDDVHDDVHDDDHHQGNSETVSDASGEATGGRLLADDDDDENHQSRHYTNNKRTRRRNIQESKMCDDDDNENNHDDDNDNDANENRAAGLDNQILPMIQKCNKKKRVVLDEDEDEDEDEDGHEAQDSITTMAMNVDVDVDSRDAPSKSVEEPPTLDVAPAVQPQEAQEAAVGDVTHTNYSSTGTIPTTVLPRKKDTYKGWKPTPSAKRNLELEAQCLDALSQCCAYASDAQYLDNHYDFALPVLAGSVPGFGFAGEFKNAHAHGGTTGASSGRTSSGPLSMKKPQYAKP
jgi:hypothetical protein